MPINAVTLPFLTSYEASLLQYRTSEEAHCTSCSGAGIKKKKVAIVCLLGLIQTKWPSVVLREDSTAGSGTLGCL